MKHIVVCLLLWTGSVVFSGFCYAQNSAPEIVINAAQHYTVLGFLSIDYELEDQEQDTCTVEAFFSTDGGQTFSPFGFFVSQVGDVGKGILPGVGKQITYNGVPALFDSATVIKLIAYDHVVSDLSPWLDKIDTTRLKNDLEFIAGDRNHIVDTARLRMVRDSLGAVFSESGFATQFQPVPYGGYAGANVVGQKRGLVDDSASVIIDAHFDAVPNSPGANDNGIATVALMEAARILSEGYFQHSINLLGFDLEEYGLLGSEKYVQNLDVVNTSVLAVLNMEMIGYFTDLPNSQRLPFGFNQLFPSVYQAIEADSFRGNFLVNVGNTNSAVLQTTFDSLSAVYAPGLIVRSVSLPGTGTIAPDFRRSDHAPFWDAGIPALMLTAGADFRDSAYHSSEDTLGRVSFDKAKEVITAVLATAIYFANPLNAGEDETTLVIDNGGDNIQDLLPNNQVVISPNPGENAFSLRSEWELLSVKVLDLQGREVVYILPATKEVHVDSSKWPSGMYMIKVETRQGFWSSRWQKGS